MSTTESVLGEVKAERARQDSLWGEQSHENGTGTEWYIVLAHSMKRSCDNAVAEGRVTWANILEEEVYEALAEFNPPKLRAELVQVAAVAVSWIQAIDRAAKDAALK